MQHNGFLISVTTLIVTLLYGLSAVWITCKGSRPKLWIVVILAAVLAYILALALLSWYQPGFLEKLMFSYSLLGIFVAGVALVYCRSLMFPWKSNRRLLLLLLSVTGAYVVLYAVCSAFYKPAFALHTFGHVAEHTGHPVVIVRLAAFATFIALFVYFCIQMVLKYRLHQTFIAGQFSFRENISLSQLSYMAGFFMLYGMVSIVHILFIDVWWIYVTANFIYTGFYLCMSIMGLRQQDIYTKAEIEQNKIESQSATGIISADLRSQLTQELTRLMLHGQAYRNPELRINDVAKALNTNRTYISTIIREHFNDNFIGLVNRYRVGEAKALLSGSNTLSIIDISHQIGFKSVTSFNLFFKKETGVNPTQFRKNSGKGDFNS